MPSTTDSVMTDIPHHQGKGLSPNQSAATARSLLAWLECKAGINPGIVLEANRILKAGTHLSPQSMLFHSRAVSIIFAYTESFSLPHLIDFIFTKKSSILMYFFNLSHSIMLLSLQLVLESSFPDLCIFLFRTEVSNTSVKLNGNREELSSSVLG